MRIVLVFIAAAACARPSAAPPLATPVAPPPASVASDGPLGRGAAKFPKVDFDGDGLSDLAFSAVERPGKECTMSAEGKTCGRPPGASRMVIAVFLGRDRGTLSQTIELATGPDPHAMARSHEVGGVGDLDGDGRTELAVNISDRGAERLLLLRGMPDGLSEPYASIALPKIGTFWYAAAPQPAGDVDGDGHRDVVIGPAILHGVGGGKLRDPVIVSSPSGKPHPPPTLLPVGDVTGDGVDDLVIAQGTPAWHVEAWLVPSKPSTPITLRVPGLHAAWDLDGDGKSELVGVARAGSHLEVTTYALTVSGATALASIQVPGDDVHGIALADTDGSGVRDVAVVTSVGRVDVPCALTCTGPANVHVRIVRGGRQLALLPRPPMLAGSQSERVSVRAVGDLDGDGAEELAEIRGVTWHIAKSGGGMLTLAPLFATAPRELELLTTHAHFDPGR